MPSPSWDDVEVGDKVLLELRVNVEHKLPASVFVKGVSGRGMGLYVGRSQSDYTLKSVEKPVRTFRPGDVVREKSTGRVYTVADNGYYNHTYKTVVMYAAAGFDSSRYELVEG